MVKEKNKLVFIPDIIKDNNRFPSKIKIDKFFMRQLGKWVGDKTNKGGDVGITGINFITFKEWVLFLKKLNQPTNLLRAEINFGLNRIDEVREITKKLEKIGVIKEKVYLHKDKREEFINSLGIGFYISNNSLRKNVLNILSNKEMLGNIFQYDKKLLFAFLGGFL